MEILCVRGMIALLLFAPAFVIGCSFVLRFFRLDASIVVVIFSLLGLCFIYFSPQIFQKMGWIQRVEDTQAIQIQEKFAFEGVYLNTMNVHNAAALSFGNNKSVVFTKKTREESSEKLLYGLAAHELGHHVYYHSVFQIVIIAICITALLFLDRTLLAWGFTKRYAVFFIACFVLILCYLALSRLKEKQADHYTREQGYGQGLVSYFQLVIENQSSGSYTRYHNIWYLHDILKERIEYLQGK